jgi:polar amino acid transport system substrate-binding protein
LIAAAAAGSADAPDRTQQDDPPMAPPAAPLATAATPAGDPRIADLVAAGRLRVGLFPPQYDRDPATGALRGPWFEVMRALAAHIGVELVVVAQPDPAAAVRCLETGTCDVASLGFDPARAAQVEGFTPPFMQVDYSYLVPAGSAIRATADADRQGVRIAAVRHHASTLALGRILQHAAPIGVGTLDAAFDLLRGGQVDAWASIRPTLMEYSTRWPGSRVLADSYGANRPALVVANGQAARLAYLSEFIAQARASGALRQAIDRAGQAGYRAAGAD